jgi:hypothetical protein
VSELMERDPGLYLWNVYFEEADGTDPAQFIGTMRADTAALAINLAAQYYEIPPHDLVVKRSDLDVQE